MVVAAVARRGWDWVRGLFPPKSGPKGRQKRSNSDPKGKQIAFRPPEDLLAYIKSVEALGYSKTEAILRLMYISRDLAVALGPVWWDVERLAHLEGKSVGVVLAGLVQSALKSRR